ncbi:unnamed protein product [Darwinula stevensoni]|uniref:FHF complex subunit HOOK-interacting protein C-terminal domain-containing protein n=1 Tax=Darwinula stevensoni TaxID=69355 RepID=A0A7R8XBM7_9CRUS|nr:unnamed protein product [Darwinula stevensoni]CAG0892986.1 unnamed protein product [Darwinula stevensoni]
MSLFSKGNPFRSSARSRVDVLKTGENDEPDRNACFSSFQQHWHQVLDVIKRTTGPDPIKGAQITTDDVCLAVNNLEQISLLVALDAHLSKEEPGPILSTLLMEDILGLILEWTLECPEEQAIPLKLEQLKIYENILNISKLQVWGHKVLLRPLLTLISSCKETGSSEVDRRLVILLNHLCVSLMQDMELLNEFFNVTPEEDPSRFILFSLLIPFVHREGSIGQQARDALLLCMAISRQNEAIAGYIARHSSLCPVLAAGLSGLYSALPRKLDVHDESWHGLTHQDLESIPELRLFLNSVEFTNAIFQISHPLIQKHLLEFLFHGFLIPVMGPALHLIDHEELVAATAYMDLILRTVTEPLLLQIFLKFTLSSHYENMRVIDTIIARINLPSPSKWLCLVNLSLLYSLVNLNCEDVMLDLIFRYLIPQNHVMLSQRHKISEFDISEACKLLSLVPACCSAEESNQPGLERHPSPTPSLPARLPTELSASDPWHVSETHFGTPPGTVDLGMRFAEYLRNAGMLVQKCNSACQSWKHKYDGKEPKLEELDSVLRESVVLSNDSQRLILSQENSTGTSKNLPISSTPVGKNVLPSQKPFPSVTEGSLGENGLDSGVGEQSDASLSPFLLSEDLDKTLKEIEDAATMLGIGDQDRGSVNSDLEEMLTNCSLIDLTRDHEMEPGGSSSDDEDPIQLSDSPDENGVEERDADRAISPLSSAKPFQSVPTIGPFLVALMTKLEGFLNNDIHVNIQLTKLLTRLAAFPQPPLRALLLSSSLTYQPTVRCLTQVLGSLKQKIDATTNGMHLQEGVLNDCRRAFGSISSCAPTKASHVIPDGHKVKSDGKKSSLLGRLFPGGGHKESRHPKRGHTLQHLPDGFGYKWSKVTEQMQPSDWNSQLQGVVMVAVHLEDWLQELAAVALEQCVANIPLHYSRS